MKDEIVQRTLSRLLEASKEYSGPDDATPAGGMNVMSKEKIDALDKEELYDDPADVKLVRGQYELLRNRLTNVQRIVQELHQALQKAGKQEYNFFLQNLVSQVKKLGRPLSDADDVSEYKKHAGWYEDRLETVSDNVRQLLDVCKQNKDTEICKIVEKFTEI